MCAKPDKTIVLSTPESRMRDHIAGWLKATPRDKWQKAAQENCQSIDLEHFDEARWIEQRDALKHCLESWCFSCGQGHSVLAELPERDFEDPQVLLCRGCLKAALSLFPEAVDE